MKRPKMVPGDMRFDVENRNFFLYNKFNLGKLRLFYVK